MKAFAPYIGWLLAGIMVVIFIMYFKNGCNKPAVGDNTRDSVIYWKNQYGQVIASLKKTEADFGSERKGYLDSIAKVNKTSAKYLKEILQYQVQGKDTIHDPGEPVVTTVHDTVHANCPDLVTSLSKKFSDPYYDADVKITLTGPGSFAAISMKDTLTAVWKTVKQGSIFNRKTYLQLDLHSTNPYNHFTGMHAYRQPEYPAKRWGIGITAGYGYGFNVASSKPFPFIGIGLMYSIIRF